MEDPSTRLKNLVEKANDFNVDHKIPAVRYLRSSKEMERMVKLHFFSFLHFLTVSHGINKFFSIVNWKNIRTQS